MVANHAIGLVGGQFPNRKAPTLLVDVQETADEIGGALAINERIEGMRRPKGIPQRKNGILDRFALVDLLVVPAVAPIHIRGCIGVNHHMIERGVENPNLAIGKVLDDDLAEFIIPSSGGRVVQF